MEIASIIISSIALIGIIVVLVLLLKDRKPQNNTIDLNALQDALDNLQEFIQRDINNTRVELKTSIDASTKAYNEAIGPYLKSFNDKLDVLNDTINDNLSNIRDRLARTTQELTEKLGEGMEKMTQSNEKKLDEMRVVVDEKLQSTLEKRINAAFEQVTAGLADVQKRFGEMTKLSSQVSDLNKNFMNIKTRGTWGETSLEGLLEQIMAPEQYEKQYMLTKGSKERVDFVIKLPGKTEKDLLLLPIDSKFPIEDYNRLVDASLAGEQENIQKEADNLKKSVKAMAQSIKEKYIKVPTTTDFAVMYLPTEGLYSEIVKDPDLVNELRSKYKVLPCGPTVLAALLNSFSLGFQTLKIQKSSGEIAKVLLQFQKDFGTFTDLLVNMKGKAQKVVDSIDEVEHRRKLIQERLSKVGQIADNVLEAQPTEINLIGDIQEPNDEQV